MISLLAFIAASATASSPAPTACDGDSSATIALVYPDSTVTVRLSCGASTCGVRISRGWRGELYASVSEDRKLFGDAQLLAPADADDADTYALFFDRRVQYVRFRRGHGAGRAVVSCLGDRAGALE